MNACEHHELEISALLDGESTPAGAIAVLDHVTRCPSCRLFYREARTFQECIGGLSAPLSAGTAPPVATPGSGKPPAPGRGRGRRPIRSVPRWSWPLAAALVIALGWWISGELVGRRAPSAAASAPMTIQLGSDPEAMSDARFLELTRELLQADQGYRRMMLGLLSALDRGEDETAETSRYAIHQVESGEGGHHEDLGEPAAATMRLVN